MQVHACACTFNAYNTSKTALDFSVRTRDSKHTRHTRDAHHKLALGLPHYTCGVTTGTVAVGSEKTALQLIGFFICYNEYHLVILLKRRGHTEHSRIFLCCWWIRSSIVQRVSVSLNRL